MFDYLSGSVATLSQNLCVLDTHGIGWSLIISSKCAGSLAGKKEAKLYTYLNMGSSDRATMELFGFSGLREREFFLLLIGISGIGPKAAISILSALDPEELAMCVLSGDAKSITAAQGIGMKGAQKIILELKDKIAKTTASPSVSSGSASSGDASICTEAINALVVLGYQPQIAATVVRSVAEHAKDLQDLIRLALKSMGDK
ncbi:MAG: Holliday junction branch migration protein RuvA [Clostridia bacterium]|nr:Holliday junction branch migration protein RuvA [Clostridia bacterium]